MEGFNEQIIIKKKGPKEVAIIMGTIFGVIIILFVAVFASFALPQFAFLFFILIAASIYGVYFLIIRQNVEYEYSVFRGDIDIDKIIAQRKRERVVSVPGRRIESLEPYDHAKKSAEKFDRTVVAAPSLADSDLWCFTYRSKTGNTLVIISPNKKILDGLTKGLAPHVLSETKRHII